MTRRFENLVVDTGPLITGAVTADTAATLWTVPEVLEEVKDRETRERLQQNVLPLKFREPSAEAVKVTVAAAKTTGDYASLSKTDLKLVALMVTLAMEAEPERDWQVKVKTTTHQGSKPEPVDDAKSDISKKPTKSTSSSQSVELPSAGKIEQISAVPDLGESFEGEWITPDNFETKLGKSSVPKTTPTDTVPLACMTGDFAVQNLLLALRLKLYSSDGKRVRQIRSFLLRCHTCYWTTLKMEMRFCESCGNASLLRTSYSVDSSGNRHLFLKADFQFNLRGTKYSLPMPKGGRRGDIVLRADQTEYQRALRRQEIQAQKMAKAGDDAVDERLAAVFGDMSVSSGKWTQQKGRAQIGHGRRNPNEVRR